MVKTVILTVGTPQAVAFSEAYPFYWIDNKTSGDVYASVGGTPEPDTDGTYTIAAGSQLRISGGDFNGGIVLFGEGKVQVVASGIAACPFKSAPVSGGGEGGDADTVNGHTVDADVPADAVFTDTTYEAATPTEDGLMSAEDKTKLDGIEEGANYYTKTMIDAKLDEKAESEHTHSKQDITDFPTIPTKTSQLENDSDFVTQTALDNGLSGKAASSHTHDSRYYTETEIDAKLDEKAGKDAATQSADGLMSAEDKVKLDNITTSGGLSVELIATSSSLSSNGTLAIGYTQDILCYDAIYVNFEYGANALVSCFILVSDLSKKISFTTNTSMITSVAPNTHDLSYFHFYANGSSATGKRQIGIKNNGSSTAFVNVRAYGITGISGLT